MTVQNQNVKNVYRGNGSTTVFPFTFAINESHPEYIHVYITNDGGKAAETTDFTCDMETRTITYPKVSSSAPKLSATQRLTIYRLLPYEQNLNLVNQGPFFSEDVETQLDDLEMQIQQLSENLVRCFQIGIEAQDFDMTMELEPGKVICVNSDGNGFEAREAMMEVSGHWDGEGRQIHSVADPTSEQDAATKKYVDEELDTAIENLQLLADVVVDSGELQHITDQFNAIDANAAAAAESEDNALSYKNAAANSATNASNSATSATNTANALIIFLADKETITAPAVDTTLSVAGAAADAKVTGDTFDAVKGGVEDALVEKYVQGNPIVIQDGASNVAVKECKVELPYDEDGYTSVTFNNTIDNYIDLSTFGLYDVTGGGVYRDAYKPFDLKAGSYTFSYQALNEGYVLYVVNVTNHYAVTEITTNPQIITLNSDATVIVRYSSNGGVEKATGVKLQAGVLPTPYIQPRTITATLTGIGATIYGGTLDLVKGTILSKYNADGTPLSPNVSYSLGSYSVLTSHGKNRWISYEGKISLIYRVFAEAFDYYIKDYDVVIVGGGAAGIGACYALKDSGLKVALIEKDERIGGNHINAWVNGAATSLPPKYMSDLYNEMIGEGSAYYTNGYTTPVDNDDETKSWVWGKYRTDGVHVDYAINYNQKILFAKYIRDLEGKIDIYTDSKITGCIRGEDTVKSIIVNDETLFNAKIFIDSSGNDDLLRAAGVTLLVGEESKTYFEGSYGFTESYAPDINYPDSINTFTLYYRIMKGTEDLSDVSASYMPDSLIYPVPYNDKWYVNNIHYLQRHAYLLLQIGEQGVYDVLKPETIRQWKEVKITNASRFEQFDLPHKRFDKVAPKLGIRETYRALCERMLSQDDITTKMLASDITVGNPLDCLISCGTHGADITSYDNHVDLEELNEHVQVYGVKYGSIIPVDFKNVFVASRGAGFTHIGASSFRLTKNMAMIGNFAGYSALYAIENNLTDVRDVDVPTVQGRDYADILDRMKEVAKMIE